METFSVHGAPSEYILQVGALDALEAKLLERDFRKVLFVHGQKSWEAAKPFLPAFCKIVYEEYSYSGDCSLTEIEKLTSFVDREKFDALIGVGGGKVLDLTKASCNETKTPVVIIPTLPSNCSPWTPLSVIYDESGAFICYNIYPVSASLVLVEPNILLNAPINMLINGIGDTLAKWYEADVQMGSLENKSVPLEISYYSARKCKDILLQHSESAICAAKTGEINEDFVKVIEAIIVFAGMVGGFGDHYGRVAGAHSIHNGLTILDETHHATHGEKVAYGILVQLALEGKWGEIEQLFPFYHKLGLPVSIHELGVKEINDEMIKAVAEKAILPDESIHVMYNGPITAENVRKAIAKLEEQRPISLSLA